MGRFDTTKATINANIKKNGNQEITGSILNSVMTEMVDATDAELTELSEGKADKNGKYADLTAGDLYGHGESVPAEFTFRASGGKSIKDGTAYIKEVHGNSVVWNQIIDESGIVGNNSEIAIISNGYTVTPSGSAPGIRILSSPIIPVVGHKYLLLCDKIGGSRGLYLNWGGYNSSLPNPFFTASDSSKTTITIYSYLETETFTLTQPRLIDLTKAFPNDWENINTIEVFYKLLPTNIDINAYNEGVVIPFTASGIKSVGDNAWDEEWELGNIEGNTGELISGNFVRSKNPIPIIGGEQYWCNKRALLAYNSLFCYDSEGSYIQRVDSITGYYTLPKNAAFIRFRMSYDYGTTYNHDITISLYHSGWKAEVDNTYKPYWEDTLLLDSRIKEAFPNGMYRAGSAYDEIRFNKETNKWEAVQRIKAVKMKDLNVKLSSGSLFYVSLSDIKLPTTDAERLTGLLSNRYDISASAGTSEMGDKTMLRFQTGTLYIKDLSYTDASSLKASFNDDDILCYELAEPIVTPLGEFALDYKVADFGTEEIIGSEPSAPFNGRTIYQFNAVDQIRENYNEIEKIKAALAKAGITI